MHEIRRLRPDASFSWIGTKGGVEERLVNEAKMPFNAIAAGKLRRYFSWQNFIEPLTVTRGFFQARRLLQAEGADAVVSAGGFVAVPVAWAAWSLGIPVHVHQQDVIPGLANRLTLPVASSLSVTLEKSVKDFPRHKAAWTGNPVRAEVLAGSRALATSSFGLTLDLPVVLVVGGGTGATGLNRLVWQSLPALTAGAQVMHLAGAGKSDASKSSPRYHQFELLTGSMPEALAAADIVVTRAGMGQLSELAALDKPTVIIPMPASHQEANAEAFAAGGGAVVLDQRDTTPETFAATIDVLLRDVEGRAVMAKKMRAMNATDAAERIALTVIGLAEARTKADGKR
jgi:UDP-N-acetylglucosamine--N-acetylmuramyl-(pentapeptide) pyrophosphoryl-undecaprenol N-acetylglucosamine transferase